MGVQYYFVQPLLELSSWNDNSSTCDQEELATQVESSSEDELAEYWDNVDLDQITRDFDFDECEKLDNDNYQSDIPNGISRFMLVFLPLWASFYNVSDTALNHLTQFIHYVLSALAASSPTVAAIAGVFQLLCIC